MTNGRSGGAERRNRLPWALVALAPVGLALTTWDPAGSYNPTQGWFRLYGVAAVACEIAVIFYSVFVGADLLRPIAVLRLWAKAALGVLIGIGAYTAVVISPDELRGLTWTFLSIVHLAFGLAVASLVRETASPARLGMWKAVLLGLAGYLCVVVIFVAIAMQKHTLNWEYFGLGGTNIRQVGFYAVVGAGAGLGIAPAEAQLRLRMIYVAASVLMFALAFWSGSRGALLAVFVAFAGATVFLPVFRTIAAWLMLIVSITGGALLSALLPIPNALYGIARIRLSSSGGGADLSSGRFDMWAGTWDAILHRPLTGYGAGQYFAVVHDKLGGFNHPHNIMLQVLFQWGFVGAACYFSLAILLLWRAAQALRAPEPADAPALLVLLSLLTISLYDGGLFTTYPTMMVALAVALIIAPRRERSFQEAR